MNSPSINSIPIISQNQNLVRAVKDGSKVFVRVLEKSMEQGKYIVSFEGTKFEITSKIPLEIGRGFKATAQIQNNTIKLIPETERAELALSLQKFSDKDIEKNEKLESFMKEIGLENDETSFKLLQLMFQAKLKINPQLIKKANAQGKNINKKNGKISKTDASIASLELSLKEINDTEEAIEQIVPSFVKEESQNYSTSGNHNSKNENRQDKNRNEKLLGILNFYENKDFLYKKASFLTAYNHIKIPKTDLHNIILPFEYEGSEGVIMIFFDTFKQKTIKINLNYTTNEKKYYFVIYLDSKKKIEIFEEFVEKNDSKIDSQTIISMMKELFPEFSLSFDENAKKSFLLPTDEPISIATEMP